MAFLFRRDQRRAIKLAVAALNKLLEWDAGIGALSPRSRLSRTRTLPTTGTPSPASAANALIELLEAQLDVETTAQNVPIP